MKTNQMLNHPSDQNKIKNNLKINQGTEQFPLLWFSLLANRKLFGKNSEL